MTPDFRHDSDEGGLKAATAIPAEWRRAAQRPILVLGFGNVLLGDDGAGVRMVERLQSEGALRFCEFVDGGTLSFSLLSYVEAADSMVIIDAAELGRPAGSIALFEGGAMDEFLRIRRRRSVHEVGLIDLLDMARLHECLPQRRALMCIQPGRIEWSDALTPPVSDALSAGSDRVSRLIAGWDIE